MILNSFINFNFILANFALPDMGEEAKVFTELIFPDLDKEEAKKLVEEYNKVSFYCKIRVAIFKIL